MFNKKKIEYLENRVQALERHLCNIFNDVTTLQVRIDKMDKRLQSLEKTKDNK